MNRRRVIAAAVGVAALAGGVGGWLLWLGRSPFRDRPGGLPPGASSTAPGSTAAGDTPEIVGAGRLVWTLAGHTAPPVSRVVSRDGTKALSGGGHGDGAVRVWDIERGQPLTRFTGHGEKCDVLTVAFGGDGATAISAAGPADDSLRVWDLASGQERTQLSGDIGFLFRAISDDGTQAVAQEINAQGRSKSFSLWSIAEGRRIAAVDAPDHASAVAISPAGDTILTGGEDGSLTLWTAAGGKLPPRLRRPRARHHGAERGVLACRPAPRDERRRPRRRHRPVTCGHPVGSRDRRLVPHDPQRHPVRPRRRRAHPRRRGRRDLDPRPRRHHRTRAGAPRRARRRRHRAGLRARRQAPRLGRARSDRPRLGPPGANPT
jgi:hypothetical protein